LQHQQSNGSKTSAVLLSEEVKIVDESEALASQEPSTEELYARNLRDTIDSVQAEQRELRMNAPTQLEEENMLDTQEEVPLF
jgi:hypothetical protein